MLFTTQAVVAFGTDAMLGTSLQGRLARTTIQTVFIPFTRVRLDARITGTILVVIGPCRRAQPQEAQQDPWVAGKTPKRLHGHSLLQTTSKELQFQLSKVSSTVVYAARFYPLPIAGVHSKKQPPPRIFVCDWPNLWEAVLAKIARSTVTLICTEQFSSFTHLITVDLFRTTKR